MMKKRVKITVCGTDYWICTDKSAEYTEELGREIDENMRDMLEKNTCLSMTQAAILNALAILDSYHEAESSADNLRTKVAEYLDDASKARSETDVFRREVERLNVEVRRLRDLLGETEDEQLTF